MSFKCPELNGLADQLTELCWRRETARTIEQINMIEGELERLRSAIDSHLLICEICKPKTEQKNSELLRHLGKSA